MPGIEGRRPWPPPTRFVIIVGLLVCVATTASSSFGVGRAQGTAGESLLAAASRAIAHGQLAEAEALAKARPQGDSDAAAILGRLAARAGRHDEALRVLEPAAAATPGGEAALVLGLLYQRLGRLDAASSTLTRVFRQGASSTSREVLLRSARAAHALNRAQDANVLFRAAAAGGLDPAIETAWGELFLQKHKPAEAFRSFKQVLEADPKWAPAHSGVARLLIHEDPPAAAGAAARALEIDPGLAEPHLVLASLELDNTRYEEARTHIGRVLQGNPSHLDARALLAAVAYVRDDRASYEQEIDRILAINPAFGEAYRVAGDLAARNYRFEEAVALARQAVNLDPSNSRAFADLGMHLLRLGEEVEARRALERAFEADGTDQVTFNLLNMLDALDKFQVFREGDIVLKLHPEEAAVMREYAMPLAQDALKTLSAKYQFVPKGPILVEIFPRHDDFAVRTLGLPGLHGALGACFGRVVSLDSPRAREPGAFSWQATLWHEMAHVVTLQMSKQRVPRWLTEGISVYEETRARPAWGRDMEVPFAIALEEGRALKLRDLNSGFTRGDTIALAYYQASLLVEHIVASRGEAALRALVAVYGDGLEGDEAVAKGLGVTIDALQASFESMLNERFAALRAALRDQAKPAPAESPDIEALRRAAASQPGSFRAQMALGSALAAQGDKAAFEPLERAAALVPVATGEKSPHAIMARLAEQLGDAPRAVAEYQRLLAQDHTAIEPARRLAALATKTGDDRALVAAYERIVEIDPFDPQGHTGLGRLAMKRRDANVAVREFRAALAIGPTDRAAAHCDLGEGYLLAGRPADAKREALAALEIAPSFERAQELLLKVVDGKSDFQGRSFR